MSNEKKPAKRLYTLAAAIGLALGTMGIAAAASTPAAPPANAPQTVSGDQATAPETETEAPNDEADGIDHQFQGEEVGNNGDGIVDANEASEVETPEANEAAEVESADDEADGIDHQFEGEEVGNNGDGVPDAHEAAEANG